MFINNNKGNDYNTSLIKYFLSYAPVFAWLFQQNIRDRG